MLVNCNMCEATTIHVVPCILMTSFLLNFLLTYSTLSPCRLHWLFCVIT